MVAWLVSLGRWKNWVFSTLPMLSGPRVLELGHGPGHLQTGLAKKGLTGFGLDRSRQMGAIAKSRSQKAGKPSRLMRGEAGRLPFVSGAFDEVVATFPTESILSDQGLREARRVLKDQGRLVVVPTGWITGGSPLERLAAWLFRATGQAGDWGTGLQAKLEAAGFAASLEAIDLPGSRVALLRGVKRGS